MRHFADSAGHAHRPPASEALAERYYARARRLITQGVKVERSYDQPWLANRTRNGKVLIIDRHVPVILKCGINTTLSLAWHEMPEWLAMNDGLRYDDTSPGSGPTAHNDVATPLERREVERQQPDDPHIWKTYEVEMNGYIRRVDDETIESVAPDQDLRQFAEDDRKLLGEIMRKEQQEFGDAAKRPAADPTGTGTIRRRFIADLEKRWSRLCGIVNEAIGQSDVLGLGAPSVGTVTSAVQRVHHARLASDDKVAGFKLWFDEALRQVLLSHPWTDQYVDSAVRLAEQRASKLVGRHGTSTHKRVQHLRSMALAELRGVADATSQQATRIVGNALLASWRPAKIAREVSRRIKAIGIGRSRLMANHMVVLAFNKATLDAFRSQGIKQVGTVPERKVLLKRTKYGVTLADYSPDQPRDERGRFTKGGGVSKQAKQEPHKHPQAPKPKRFGIQRAKERATLKENVAEMCRTLGYSPQDVRYVTQPRTFTLNGRRMNYAGSCDVSPGSKEFGKITLYMDQVSNLSRTSIGSIVSHEIEHAKFATWVQSPEGKRAFGSLNPGDRDKLTKEDGVSDYSRQYWKALPEGNTTFYVAAHETLAEMASAYYTTGHLPGSAGWKRLYRAANGHWNRTRAKRDGFMDASVGWRKTESDKASDIFNKRRGKGRKRPSRREREEIEARERRVQALESVYVITAGDEDVCEECIDISEDGPYDIDEAEGLIPAHNQCRCAFIPAEDARFGEPELGDAMFDEFEEEKHPRGEHGRFAASGGAPDGDDKQHIANQERIGRTIGWVKEAADEANFPMSRITVTDEDRYMDFNGKAVPMLGSAQVAGGHPDFGKVTIYSNQVNELTAGRAAAHEIEHIKYAHFDLEADHKLDVVKLSKDDGVTDYSKLYWGQYEKQPSAANFHLAAHETLAEMAAEKWQTGNLPGSGAWKNLFNKVDAHWRGRK